VSCHQPTTVSVFSRREDGGLGLLSYRQHVALKEQTRIFESVAAFREYATPSGSDRIRSWRLLRPAEARALLSLAPGNGVVISEVFREREFRGVDPVRINESHVLVMPSSLRQTRAGRLVRN